MLPSQRGLQLRTQFLEHFRHLEIREMVGAPERQRLKEMCAALFVGKLLESRTAWQKNSQTASHPAFVVRNDFHTVLQFAEFHLDAGVDCRRRVVPRLRNRDWESMMATMLRCSCDQHFFSNGAAQDQEAVHRSPRCGGPLPGTRCRVPAS